MHRSSTTSNLDILQFAIQNLYPVCGWIYVGAGDGRILEQLSVSNASHLLAIEADKDAYKCLLKRAKNHVNWSVLQTVVGFDDAETYYYSYFNSDENGLLSSDKLIAIWKNLRLRKKLRLPTRSLASILEEEGREIAYNWLTLDCLPAVPLLKGLGPRLNDFDVIQLRVAFADGMLDDLGASRKVCEGFMTSHGFKSIFIEEENNAALGYIFYLKDWKYSLTKDNSRLISLFKEDACKLKSIFEQEKNALISSFQEEKLSLGENKGEDDCMTSELKKIIDSLDKDKAELLCINESLTARLNAEERDEKKFHQIVDELGNLKASLSKSIKIHTENSAKQIGNFINLKDYLETGNLPEVDLETNGWPASSDFMLYLVRLIEHTRYDLIIEFGSGTSTVVVAKTIKNIADKYGEENVPYFASFDHLEKYYLETSKRLNFLNLGKYVELQHAPLDNYVAPNGEKYLYYDCYELLTAIKNRNKTPLHVLVIVDGPPGGTQKHARYPAASIIWEIFESQKIDLLLDDASRKEEKEIAEKWINDFLNVGYEVDEEFVSIEKTAFLLKARKPMAC